MTFEEMQDFIGKAIRKATNMFLDRIIVKLNDDNSGYCIEALVAELQHKGYWVEYRKISGSSEYILKIEW